MLISKNYRTCWSLSHSVFGFTRNLCTYCEFQKRICKFSQTTFYYIGAGSVVTHDVMIWVGFLRTRCIYVGYYNPSTSIALYTQCHKVFFFFFSRYYCAQDVGLLKYYFNTTIFVSRNIIHCKEKKKKLRRIDTHIKTLLDLHKVTDFFFINGHTCRLIGRWYERDRAGSLYRRCTYFIVYNNITLREKRITWFPILTNCNHDFRNGTWLSDYLFPPAHRIISSLVSFH